MLRAEAIAFILSLAVPACLFTQEQRAEIAALSEDNFRQSLVAVELANTELLTANIKTANVSEM